MQNDIKSYDPIWESVFTNQNWGKYPGESLIQFIARNYYNKDRPNIRILEIGCGPGANIWFLSRENFDVYGIDGSKTAIDIANHRIESELCAAKLFVGDIISLPFENGFFDCVLDVECLYSNNRSNSETILSEVKRVLKNDGLFYSRTFAEDMYLGKNKLEIGPFEYNNVSEGPLSGKGFVRLSNKAEIMRLYGKFLHVMSIDKMQYTINNGNLKISEYIILCKNE